MKILNIKVDKQRITYIIVSAIAIILAIYLALLCAGRKSIVMNVNNFTNILKAVHEDISRYIGKKIESTGYIFRAKDFNDNQFVLARDMLVTNDSACIVGFLCEYPYAYEFEDNVWVQISGTITQGEYYGVMPIIKIDTIQRITTPEDIFVYPPKH